ncbi:MAG TPA: PAS domain S-box protein [Steroidobacteraceae bacterium]|nr:PAS domain S-box protein [Steroidobacteraceae bacterium]
MKLNTAVCFAAFGAATLALASGRRRTASICCLAVAAIAAATESQYVLAVDLRIDELLADAFLVEPNVPPGRMSPITAALFILASGSLGLLTTPESDERTTVAGVLASVIAGVALSALIGHLTRTPTAYSWTAATSVAVHTAAGFLLVAAAIGAHAARRAARPPDWLPWAAFIGGMACTLALGGALFYELRDSPQSLVPELVLAVGATLSMSVAFSVRARLGIGEQRDLLAASLQRTQEALAERARLAAIVESSNEAIMSLELDTTIVTFNRAAERLYGYSAQEIRGRSIRTLVPPQRLAEFAERIEKTVLRGDSVHGLRTQRRHRNGKLIDVELDIAPLLGADGKPVGALSITRDIGERLAAERLVHGVLEAAPDAMIVVDESGSIALANTMAVLMFGYTKEGLVGAGIDQLIPESSRAAHAAYRQSYIEQPRARAMGDGRELLGLRRDGSVFPVEISLNALESGGRMLVVSSVRDITARRAADQRLQASLQEKELLLKEIHHRVKNNLQVVASMLTLQAELASDADAKSMLEACRQRVASMALVHEKLYGAADLRRMDLRELIRDIAAMLIGGCGGISLQMQPRGEPIVVDIETAFPVSLIANELITNAIKHAFAGRNHGTITIDVDRSASGRARLQVADDGVGGVTPQTFESSGNLGSTIVRRLVRQIGGALAVEAGPGARISITFPLSRTAA